jgi:hypothetical protein
MKNDEKKEFFERLSEEFIEDILNASNEEIMKEAAEDFEEVDTVASRIRLVIKRAIKESGKAKIKSARNQLDNSRSGKISQEVNPSYEDRKELIERLRRNDSFGKEKITLAARDGEGKDLTESDLDAIAKDLFALAGIDKSGKIKCKG